MPTQRAQHLLSTAHRADDVPRNTARLSPARAFGSHLSVAFSFILASRQYVVYRLSYRLLLNRSYLLYHLCLIMTFSRLNNFAFCAARSIVEDGRLWRAAICLCCDVPSL